MTTTPMPAAYKSYKTGAPKGFTTLKQPTTAVAQKAKELLKNKMGDEFQFEIAGVKYFARLEPHFHPMGYKHGPNGWHKGCTVYVQADYKQDDTKQENKTIPTIEEKTQEKPVEKPKEENRFIAQLNSIMKSLMG